MPISSPNPMFYHLLESSHRDDSNKWSKIGFGEEITKFFRRLCCRGPAPVRPNFTVLCLGLGRSGKSTLLAKLSGEATDKIEPTVGFSIKAFRFEECFMDVKELGGGENVRPYWNRYYNGSQGVIFVVDSSCDEKTMEATKGEFEKALFDEQLEGLPLMVLANYQDVPGARSPKQVCEILGLEKQQRPWTITGCTASDKAGIKTGFDKFNKIMLTPGVRDGEFHSI